MSDTDALLDAALPRHLAAGEAMHNGDPTLWLKMWSLNEPVTVFGALGVTPSGTEAVVRNFRDVATRFSNGTDFGFEVIAAIESGRWPRDLPTLQNSGTPGSWPARTAPAAVRVSALTRKCCVMACTSRRRRWRG